MGLPFEDEVYKIVLNTKCSPEKIPEKLKPMYDYISNPENEIKDDFIKKVDVEVRKYNNDEWRQTLMTLEDMMNIRYKRGWNEGRKVFVLKMKESGMSIEQIAECTGLTEEEIKLLGSQIE